VGARLSGRSDLLVAEQEASRAATRFMSNISLGFGPLPILIAPSASALS
jgi:hypothetical protein